MTVKVFNRKRENNEINDFDIVLADENCKYPPLEQIMQFLGEFDSVKDALEYVKDINAKEGTTLYVTRVNSIVCSANIDANRAEEYFSFTKEANAYLVGRSNEFVESLENLLDIISEKDDEFWTNGHNEILVEMYSNGLDSISEDVSTYIWE